MMDIASPSANAPAWRAYALEARCELLRMLREPASCIPVIAFPALLRLLLPWKNSGHH